MFKTIRKLGKNYRKKEKSFPGWGSNPQPLACQFSALTTTPTRHYMEDMLNFVIFILLNIISLSHGSKTGENGSLKLSSFNIPISTLSYDISPKLGIGVQAKIGLRPNLLSDFEECHNFALLPDKNQRLGSPKSPGIWRFGVF